jgi:hypothetical protein
VTACFSLPDYFSACKTTQELPVTQLARHVDLFHLVITDNRRPETLSIPHGLAPPIKPTTHFQPSCLTLNAKTVTVLQSGPISLSFPHVVWSLFGSTLQQTCYKASYTGILLYDSIHMKFLSRNISAIIMLEINIVFPWISNTD